MSNQKVFRYLGYDCEVVKDNYISTSRIYLGLMASNTEYNKSKEVFWGEPIANCTVNLPGTHLKEGHVIIDTNNSPDMLKLLEKHNIVKNVNRTVKGGYCNYPVAELLIKE